MLLLTFRSVPGAVGAVAAVAVTPAVASAAAGAHDFAGALTAASLIAGAGIGYAADDPAAATLASSPTTLAVRRALRAAVIVVVLASAWVTALLVAAHYGRRLPDVRLLAAELTATAAMAAAVASRARTDVPVASGTGAAAVAVLVVLVIGSLAYRWPVLPALGAGRSHPRWWWLAAGGIATAAWSSRDPAAPRLRVAVKRGSLAEPAR